MVKCSPSTLPQTPRGPSPDSPPPDLYVCPFTVLRDTREQSPWSFNGIILSKRLWVIRWQLATLATGDYSIDGMQDRLLIERKSAADFTGSVTGGAARFKREHERMAEVVAAGGFACVVIEGDMARICDDLDAEVGRRVNSDHILGACASWPARYRVPWFFAGDRRRAELLAFRILMKQWSVWNDKPHNA
jgi:DNA excision repair protein ERCC-4